MDLSTVAIVFGLVFLMGGLAGFFPSPPPPGAPPLIVDAGRARLQ